MSQVRAVVVKTQDESYLKHMRELSSEKTHNEKVP